MKSDFRLKQLKTYYICIPIYIFQFNHSPNISCFLYIKIKSNSQRCCSEASSSSILVTTTTLGHLAIRHLVTLQPPAISAISAISFIYKNQPLPGDGAVVITSNVRADASYLPRFSICTATHRSSSFGMLVSSSILLTDNPAICDLRFAIFFHYFIRLSPCYSKIGPLKIRRRPTTHCQTMRRPLHAIASPGVSMPS